MRSVFRWTVSLGLILCMMAAAGFGWWSRQQQDVASQEVAWLMLTVNRDGMYREGLQLLWNAGPDDWDKIGRSLPDPERAYYNAVVIPGLAYWHQVRRVSPALEWAQSEVPVYVPVMLLERQRG